uniref:Uncharacterized protein n=1 Tax=Arundo donax TaxID=35708 RepID=A0A0A8Y4Q4_ARUDO
MVVRCSQGKQLSHLQNQQHIINSLATQPVHQHILVPSPRTLFPCNSVCDITIVF